MARTKAATATVPEKDFETQAKEYAACAIASIREMVEAMEHAEECDGEHDCPDCDGRGIIDGIDPEPDKDCETCKGEGTVKCDAGKDSDNPEAWHDSDGARQRIEEDALSVEVRSDWHNPGGEATDAEYCILITTGGPAARIVGSLGACNQPSDASFEYQDWFKPWTEVWTDSADSEVLLRYAQTFYFGEG